MFGFLRIVYGLLNKKQVLIPIPEISPYAPESAHNPHPLSQNFNRWFFDVSVEVEEGVVFMNGRINKADYRKWAGELAVKIPDVAAVVNHIQMIEPSVWDMTPVFNEMNEMWKASLKRLPRLMFGIAALLIFLLFIRIIIRYFSSILDRRLKPLLRDVTSRITTVLAVLIGIYFALQIAGLSRLATTN